MIGLLPRFVLRALRAVFAAASRKLWARYGHGRMTELTFLVTHGANVCDIELRYRRLRDQAFHDLYLVDHYPAPELLVGPFGNRGGRTEQFDDEQVKLLDPNDEIRPAPPSRS